MSLSRVADQRLPHNSRQVYVVWAVGVLAYAVAVFHRSSLGVAGIAAEERFGIGASGLALLSMLQLLVYAGMQIPVGVLLDRFGSKRLLLAGAATMAAGQLLFALASTFPLALAARVLLGFGDAMTFISVLRLVVLWFPPRRAPLITQLTGVLGQLGALASALPLVAILHAKGWSVAFAGAGLVGALVAVLILTSLQDSPSGASSPRTKATLADVRRTLALSWDEPGTRLGLWSHFVTQFSGMVFALLWGFPFLVVGQGVSPATAGVLLGVLIVAGVSAGPVLGALVGRHPFHRSRLVLAIVGITAAAWTIVLLWPGRAPTPVLVGLVIVLGINGPGAMVGFDYARTFNPAARVGSASGIVNVGGFVASLVTVVLMGIVLDLRTPQGAAYSLDSFRWAFAVQYGLWALGAVQVFRYRNAARRQLAELNPDAYAALRQGEIVTVASGGS